MIDEDPARYETKRRFRWLLRIPGIDPMFAKAASRPAYVVQYGDDASAGTMRFSLEPMELELFDCREPNIAMTVENLMRSNAGCLGDVSISMLSEIGKIYEEWVMHDSYVLSVDYGALSYDSDGLCYVKLMLGYNRFTLSVLDGHEPGETWSVTVEEKDD